ncbi:hypothetical protein NPIL_515521 [Nephila pilipes]|uniref:Uncharacterized protein n=1 Tax=Nephila pilipes TaxID=299642 RepID=A0A8X6M6N5_NEPPI|nr:hypothetical protein NPIL_515521 [Nephila pilipes]
MSLSNGQQTTGEVLTTQVMIEIDGRSVVTRFIILPKAKGNRIQLGTDFLSSAGQILDVKNACCSHRYNRWQETKTNISESAEIACSNSFTRLTVEDSKEDQMDEDDEGITSAPTKKQYATPLTNENVQSASIVQRKLQDII